MSNITFLEDFVNELEKRIEKSVLDKVADIYGKNFENVKKRELVFSSANDTDIKEICVKNEEKDKSAENGMDDIKIKEFTSSDNSISNAENSTNDIEIKELISSDNSISNAVIICEYVTQAGKKCDKPHTMYSGKTPVCSKRHATLILKISKPKVPKPKKIEVKEFPGKNDEIIPVITREDVGEDPEKEQKKYDSFIDGVDPPSDNDKITLPPRKPKSDGPSLPPRRLKAIPDHIKEKQEKKEKSVSTQTKIFVPKNTEENNSNMKVSSETVNQVSKSVSEIKL